MIKFFRYLLDDSTQAFGVRGKVLRTNDVSTGLTEQQNPLDRTPLRTSKWK